MTCRAMHRLPRPRSDYLLQGLSVLYQCSVMCGRILSAPVLLPSRRLSLSMKDRLGDIYKHFYRISRCFGKRGEEGSTELHSAESPIPKRLLFDSVNRNVSDIVFHSGTGLFL